MLREFDKLLRGGQGLLVKFVPRGWSTRPFEVLTRTRDALGERLN